MVLRHLIESKVVPVVRLAEVFRQAAHSRIITNAHRINEGYLPELPDKQTESDFYFIDLAYAITIHKSQGPEFSAVVIPLAMQQFMLLQRNLVYTGITRGKRLVVLTGQKTALGMAVKNNRTENRFSGLLARLTAA